MNIGSVVNIVSCQPRTDGGAAVAPCGLDANGVSYQPQVVQAYVIDAANASRIDAIAEPFDYAQATGLFGFAFSIVLLAWLASHFSGTILGLIRRG
jgi:hypothetical protein